MQGTELAVCRAMFAGKVHWTPIPVFRWRTAHRLVVAAAAMDMERAPEGSMLKDEKQWTEDSWMDEEGMEWKEWNGGMEGWMDWMEGQRMELMEQN